MKDGCTSRAEHGCNTTTDETREREVYDSHKGYIVGYDVPECIIANRGVLDCAALSCARWRNDMRTSANRILVVVPFAIFLVLPITADQEPPVFVFGGHRLYVGMSKHDALAALSNCCKLSPPAESDIEKEPVPEGVVLGHFIQTKSGPPYRMLGSISFFNGKVLRVTRPLADEVDTSNDDLVAFVRALKRSLPSEATDSEIVVHVSVRHERVANAESDAVFLSFSNGRGIELHIGTLDQPERGTNKRDFVTMDETLR